MKRILAVVFALAIGLQAQTKIDLPTQTKGDLPTSRVSGPMSLPLTPTPFTIATLPVSPLSNQLVLVTDSNGTCLTGGGTVPILCRWTGSGWVPLYPLRVTSYSFNVENPDATIAGQVQRTFPQAVSLVTVTCSTDTGTATLQLESRSASTPNVSGSSVLTSALVCTTTSASTSSFSVPAIAAHAPLALLVQSVTGTPGWLRLHIEFQ
jgi:hypothetical protein